MRIHAFFFYMFVIWIDTDCNAAGLIQMHGMQLICHRHHRLDHQHDVAYVVRLHLLLHHRDH